MIKLEIDLQSPRSRQELYRVTYDPVITTWKIWDLKIQDGDKWQLQRLFGSGAGTQRLRMSAIADLKEFSGRDKDEGRARSWVSNVKSAFLRDQAPYEEKCLVFGDLLTGPAQNWHSQLARSTRNS